MDVADTVQRLVLVLVTMILSLSVHEWAHAYAAMKLGDNTAEGMGRLTLNPIPHIDPIGTLLLPVLFVIFPTSFFFGWAKPVPVNPTRFTRKVTMRTGMMIVAAAGPVSNLIIAFLAAGTVSIGVHTGLIAGVPEPLQVMLVTLISLNVALFLFNLVPAYPLDGQKVLSGLLKGEAAIKFERFSVQYGSWVLLGIIFFARDILGVPMRLIMGGILTVVGLG